MIGSLMTLVILTLPSSAMDGVICPAVRFARCFTFSPLARPRAFQPKPLVDSAVAPTSPSPLDEVNRWFTELRAR